MSQKFIKSQNKNSFSQAYGKYFAQAVYDNHFIGTEELWAKPSSTSSRWARRSSSMALASSR